jgi:leucine dehydrogenase
MLFDDVIREWDGTLTCVREDHATGTVMIIAVHSRARGPAAGGTRARQYADLGAAVDDATRLAAAMTRKMAVAGLPMGGGKSVIALPAPRSTLDDDTWHRILTLHAENIAALNGGYWTGPDVGTSSSDMDFLHDAGAAAFGRSPEHGGPGSSAPETAHGVHQALRAAARFAGLPTLEGRRVLIQGVGAVGLDLAARLAADGARLVVTDVSPAAVERARRSLGAEVIEPSAVWETDADVFAPCALGSIIDAERAGRIPFRVIAGAANNVLADPEADDVLQRRGIVYAPDFLANAGGALHLVGREILGWDRDTVASKVDAIGDTMLALLEYAAAHGIGTERAATMLAAGEVSVDS